MDLKKYIANINDYPKKGIVFRDITPLIENRYAFKYVIDEFIKFGRELDVDYVVGPEARGFIFGAPVAYGLNRGFSLVRKPNKLPRETIDVEYDLEYGSNVLSMHKDSLPKGCKVLIVDDLLATGGTALAACKLCEKLGCEVVGLCFVIDLVDLKGKELLKDYNVKTLIEFEGE